MKCTVIVQNNGYFLKLKRWKQKESQLAISYFWFFSLSQVFNEINDNYKWYINSCRLSLQANKVQKYIIYIKKAVLTTPQYQKELFTLNMFPKNKQNKQTKKNEIQKEC